MRELPQSNSKLWWVEEGLKFQYESVHLWLITLSWSWPSNAFDWKPSIPESPQPWETATDWVLPFGGFSPGPTPHTSEPGNVLRERWWYMVAGPFFLKGFCLLSTIRLRDFFIPFNPASHLLHNQLMSCEKTGLVLRAPLVSNPSYKSQTTAKNSSCISFLKKNSFAWVKSAP